MKAIVCATLDEARAVRDALDRAHGYPRPGVNAVTGEPTPPGAPGWTATIGEILDVGGVVYVAGVPDELARAIRRSSIDIDPGGFGVAYALEIDRWQGSAPVLVERSRTVSPPADDIEAAKRDALRILDARKEAAMAAGFEHPVGSGLRFSLATEAQILRTRLVLVCQTTAMAWPLMWPTLDPSKALELTSPADVQALYVAESLALRAINEADAALRAQIVAAQSVAEISALLGGEP